VHRRALQVAAADHSNYPSFIDAQFLALAQLFARYKIGVDLGTTEDLSGNPNLAHRVTLDVGPGLLGQPTQEHNDLFANRNNARADDLVIYIVQSLQGSMGNFAGCATHPSGQPGGGDRPELRALATGPRGGTRFGTGARRRHRPHEQ
jgi:hypothetical protein